MLLLQLTCLCWLLGIGTISSSSWPSTAYTAQSYLRFSLSNDVEIVKKAIAAAIAGAISCSSTHSLMVPLDVAKTKIQNSEEYQKLTTVQALRSIVRNHGSKSLFDGFTATASAYFLQGVFKFGLYELFKESIVNSQEQEKGPKILSVTNLLICSAAAETVACVVMCPLEVTKIYMIMNPSVVKMGTAKVMMSIFQKEGIVGLYKGLPWITLRQVPYTCAKLVGYDCVSKYIKSKLVISQDQNHCSKSYFATVGYRLPVQSIQLISGVTAGLIAAIFSHPADVILNRLCSGISCVENRLVVTGPMSFLQAIRDMGLKGCFSGFSQRATMVSGMTAIQFVVYEQVRQRLHELMVATDVA